jgi:hypothetical protein
MNMPTKPNAITPPSTPSKVSRNGRLEPRLISIGRTTLSTPLIRKKPHTSMKIAPARLPWANSQTAAPPQTMGGPTRDQRRHEHQHRQQQHRRHAGDGEAERGHQRLRQRRAEQAVHHAAHGLADGVATDSASSFMMRCMAAAITVSSASPSR